MWIVRLALSRPYTFVVMAVLIAILGGTAIVTMPVDIFPYINIPVVSVLYAYNGLSPDEMEKRVLTPFERSLTANVNDIAASSKRLESLHFGVADYAASTRARTTVIGGPNALYGVLTDKDGDKPRDFHWGDMWHYAIARLVVAARANGLRPLDGPFGDFSDADGFKAQAYRAAVLGCEGKWAIHPSQVALANEVFSPSEAEVTKAKRILAAMEQAQKEGKGAVALDGRLIDIASIRQAENLVNKAKQIGGA